MASRSATGAPSWDLWTILTPLFMALIYIVFLVVGRGGYAIEEYHRRIVWQFSPVCQCRPELRTGNSSLVKKVFSTHYPAAFGHDRPGEFSADLVQWALVSLSEGGAFLERTRSGAAHEPVSTVSLRWPCWWPPPTCISVTPSISQNLLMSAWFMTGHVSLALVEAVALPSVGYPGLSAEPNDSHHYVGRPQLPGVSFWMATSIVGSAHPVGKHGIAYRSSAANAIFRLLDHDRQKGLGKWYRKQDIGSPTPGRLRAGLAAPSPADSGPA